MSHELQQPQQHYEQDKFPIQSDHQYLLAEIQSTKTKLIYSLHSNLMDMTIGIEAGGSDESKLKNVKQQLVDTYNKLYNKINLTQQSLAIQVAKTQLRQQGLKLLQLEDQKQQPNVTALLETQQQVVTHQASLISMIEQYLITVFQRVRNQRWLDEEKEIRKYLERQIECFRERKEEARLTVVEHDAKMAQMYEQAREVCKSKEEEIKKLQAIKKRLQTVVKREKQGVLKLSVTQENNYKQLSDLTLSLTQKTNALKLIPTSSQKDTTPLPTPSQAQFKSKNLGSLIFPIPSSSQKHPTIFPLTQSSQTTASQQSIEIRCQVSSSIETQINQRKFIVLMLFVLSIVVWLV